ncbi:MAG: MBL fold metallo-hydrolase, partial [Candidatus Dormibacteraeota bacterium]|nr:MBL fold metallo-hydrolase [Candidatus Dormibacteraeota bacterium]
MAINDTVSFTWIGHGTWRARSAEGKELLLDAWVMNNPVAPDHLKTIDRCDLMLITHGHFDHIHDALEIGKQTSPKLVAIPETATWLGSKGFPGAGQNAMNKGGTQEVEGIRVTMVRAEHSCGITDGDQVVYGG